MLQGGWTFLDPESDEEDAAPEDESDEDGAYAPTDEMEDDDESDDYSEGSEYSEDGSDDSEGLFFSIRLDIFTYCHICVFQKSLVAAKNQAKIGPIWKKKQLKLIWRGPITKMNIRIERSLTASIKSN